MAISLASAKRNDSREEKIGCLQGMTNDERICHIIARQQALIKLSSV